MFFFHTHMKKSRFSFINKNDTLYSKKGNRESLFGKSKGEKIMKETKNRAGRDISSLLAFCPVFHVLRRRNVIFPPYLGMESDRRGWPDSARISSRTSVLRLPPCLRCCASAAVRPCSSASAVPAEILMCAIILCVGLMVAIRTSASTFEMAIAPNLPGVSAVVFSVLFFRTHPRVVHPRVRRGGHQAARFHAAAAALGLCGHHRQGHRHAAWHDRGRDEDRQRRVTICGRGCTAQTPAPATP